MTSLICFAVWDEFGCSAEGRRRMQGSFGRQLTIQEEYRTILNRTNDRLLLCLRTIRMSSSILPSINSNLPKFSEKRTHPREVSKISREQPQISKLPSSISPSCPHLI